MVMMILSYCQAWVLVNLKVGVLNQNSKKDQSLSYDPNATNTNIPLHFKARRMDISHLFQTLQPKKR